MFKKCGVRSFLSFLISSYTRSSTPRFFCLLFCLRNEERQAQGYYGLWVSILTSPTTSWGGMGGVGVLFRVFATSSKKNGAKSSYLWGWRQGITVLGNNLRQGWRESGREHKVKVKGNTQRSRGWGQTEQTQAQLTDRAGSAAGSAGSGEAPRVGRAGDSDRWALHSRVPSPPPHPHGPLTSLDHMHRR